MKLDRIFSLLILLLCLYSNSFSNEAALLHYNKGVELHQQGKINEAVKELKRAIRLDKKFAHAYSKLAEIYMEEGTLQGRTKAEKEINKAIKLEPKNTEFNLVLGLLMVKQGFTYNAKHQFKRVTKLDPECVEAYYNLGLLHQDDMLRYKNMISGPIQLSKFGRDYQIKAIECFKKALEVDPNHRDSRFHLGLIYLETGKLHKMVNLFEEMAKEDPLDKDAHLFLGLGFHRVGKYQKAYDEYEIAKRLMHVEERKVFDSVDPILSPREKKEHRQSEHQSEFIRSFWKEKDPLFLTEYNERVLEHYSRIAYANLRFGVPKQEIDGYKTDRGQIYIRYGEPKVKKKIRPEIEDETFTFYPTTDVWYYDNFQFVFEDTYSSGEYTFSDAMPAGTPSHIGSRYPGSYTQQAAELRKKMPEIYEYKIKGKKFEIPHLWANFKADDNKNLVKTAYGIPSTMIKDSHASLIQKGIFLFDDKWNEVYKERSEGIGPGLVVISPEGNLYVNDKELQIKPQSYHLAIEVSDGLSGNVGIARELIVIDAYNSNNLQLSDISLLLKIALASDSIASVMNPILTYLRSQPINIYYEIYNLHKDQMGRTSYQIDYSVYKERKSKKGLAQVTQRLGDLLGISKKRAVVTLSFQGSDTVTQKPQNVTIDMADAEEGDYKLIVTLTDLNSGEHTSKEIKLNMVK